MMTEDDKYGSMLVVIKAALSVTWDEEDTDMKIIRIMEDAEVKLNHILGAEMDYTAPGPARRLFVNFCMYVWNGVEKDFKTNYLNDIYELRRINEVKAYGESKDVQ